MTVRVVRDLKRQTDKQTPGMLYADDMDFRTLELPWKDNAQNVSCIPTGTYPLVFAWSNRFQKLMPRVMNVPGRTGILIHGGETTANTDGCILVGLNATPDGHLHNSLKASQLFQHWLGIMVKDGPVSVEVSYVA